MEHITQAVILAGGLGTRLRPFTNDCPKPLFPVAGRPFLDHLLLQLRDWGITQVLLLLGYKAEQIVTHIKAHPISGLSIRCDISPTDYETGGRLYHAKELLDEKFLLIYCDNYCPIDFKAHSTAFLAGDNLIRLTAYANHDKYTKSNLRIDAAGKVLAYDKTRKTPGLSGVDIGYALVRREVLDLLPPHCEMVNFEAAIYPQVLNQGHLYASMTEHRYYSIGSWQRMPLTEAFFTAPPTVFLDRDGTLNECPPKACYVTRPEDFHWLPQAREAVAAFKKEGWQVLLFTNQPGIARGMLTRQNLDSIHARMLADLRAVGADIDGIYVCPHGWDEGCNCRKPRPGLLYQAQKERSLDLTRCFVIGDDPRDMQAGLQAGCHCVQVSPARPLFVVAQHILDKKPL